MGYLVAVLVFVIVAAAGVIAAFKLLSVKKTVKSVSAAVSDAAGKVADAVKSSKGK